MSFESGSITFRRFAVVGGATPALDEALLSRLADHAFRADESLADEVEYGWNAGRHLYDAGFTFASNAYNDCLWFALRIDTNKVPADVRRAYTLQEEDVLAKMNPSGFLSKAQKREVKETVQRQIDEDVRGGKFRRSKLVPVLWDVPAGVVYSAASGASFEKLAEIFERTFLAELQPLSAGAMASRAAVAQDRRREYEDARPTRFADGPDGEGQSPEYPWVAKGAQPKDFMGNEFLLWLWFHADAKDGEVAIDGRDVTLLLDRSLTLDCAYGMTGHDTLKASGPSRMIEARDALRTGKVPRKAFLMIHAKGNAFEFALNAEQMSLAGTKLPQVEDAETPRALFEERITLLRDLSATLDAMYGAFLASRLGPGWEAQAGQIRGWISRSVR